MKTNIYKFPKGLIIDVSGGEGKINPLVWTGHIWERINAPSPIKYDLSQAIEMTPEQLMREGIPKITKLEEEPEGEIIP